MKVKDLKKLLETINDEFEVCVEVYDDVDTTTIHEVEFEYQMERQGEDDEIFDEGQIGLFILSNGNKAFI